MAAPSPVIETLTPDGVTTTFPLQQTPIAGSLLLIYNGLIQASDYSVSGSSLTVTFVAHVGDQLLVYYFAQGADSPSAPQQRFASDVASTNTNSELNDIELKKFLSTLVAGLTGIPGTLVRPRWQPEPPNEPDFTTDWSAIGVVRRTRDVFAFDGFIRLGQDATRSPAVIRNQILETIASFYGPNCDQNSENFAMGLAHEANRAGLFINGFGLVEVQESLTVPALIKERWLSGVDVPFRMRRQQIYQFPTPYLEAANGTITLDNGTVIKLGVDGNSGFGISPYGIVPYGGG